MPVSLKLVSNLAFLIGGGLALAFTIDSLAAWMGYQTGLLCWGLMPMIRLAHAIGFFLMVVGIVVWAFTFFRNETPALIALGGFMLTLLPEILPHYLGASC